MLRFRLMEEIRETMIIERHAARRIAEATIARTKNLSYAFLVGSLFRTPAESNKSLKNFLNSKDTPKPTPTPVPRRTEITCNFTPLTFFQFVHAYKIIKNETLKSKSITQNRFIN